MNTGQCRYLMPSALSRAERCAVSAGSVVVWSMITASAASPGRAAAMTSSTTASSFSTMCTRAAPRTASAGVAAGLTPNCASAATLSCERFHAVTVSPRLAAPSAKAPPSRPVPRNAMFATCYSLKRAAAMLSPGRSSSITEKPLASSIQSCGT